MRKAFKYYIKFGTQGKHFNVTKNKINKPNVFRRSYILKRHKLLNFCTSYNFYIKKIGNVFL